MTYTFDITNNTKKNPSNINFTKSINSIISSNLKKIAPYLYDDDDTEEIIIPTTPKKTKKIIDIDITLSKGGKKTAKPDFATFSKALATLLKNKNEYEDIFDFKLEDGTPIALFSDEIQIGYELIPLTEGTKRIYDILSNSRKKEIIDIYINITK